MPVSAHVMMRLHAACSKDCEAGPHGESLSSAVPQSLSDAQTGFAPLNGQHLLHYGERQVHDRCQGPLLASLLFLDVCETSALLLIAGLSPLLLALDSPWIGLAAAWIRCLPRAKFLVGMHGRLVGTEIARMKGIWLCQLRMQNSGSSRIE